MSEIRSSSFQSGYGEILAPVTAPPNFFATAVLRSESQIRSPEKGAKEVMLGPGQADTAAGGGVQSNHLDPTNDC